MRRLVLILASLVGAGVGVGGCAQDSLETAGTDTDPQVELVDVTFTEHIEPLLVECTGCHRGDAPDGGFDMYGDDLYDRLVDQPSGQAQDLDLVEPGDAAYSYLWHKINGSQSVAGGAGTRMPLGDPWPDEDVELVALWIDLGALE